jgi:SAM-dependent methyltransferase
MGDEFPEAEVIGTDISPIQPSWVPPNVKFEIEDCTQDWTFADNTFDYVHIRYLVGSVVDWEHLLKEAYRVCKPGGWIESAEGLSHEKSSDHTVKPGMAVWDWSKFFIAYGKQIGRTFEVLTGGLQDKYIRKAGCVDVGEWNFTIPLGPWPKDPELREIGRFAYATFAPDLEGFISLPAMELLGWGPTETAVFCTHMRREMMSKEVHWAFEWKNVWGRKPLE